MNLSGTILKERYCILEPIGKGGGGKVYLARDIELGVLWAVKEVDASKKGEARMLLRLTHPCLPKMIDYIEKDGKAYIVMEYIRGNSLGKLLRDGKHFSAMEIIQYGLEIADILEYLHTRRPPVYYGDLKPDNLILTENNRLYLVDLGGAVNGYRYEHKKCIGTHGFAAPEQYEGKVNAQSDIYGLGKTLAALSGRRTFLSVMQNLAFEYFIFRCCMKNPRLRFLNMVCVRKKLSKIQKRQGYSRIKSVLLAAGSAVFFAFVTILVIFGQRHAEMGFYEKLTAVTALYHEKGFQEGNVKEQKKICEKADKMLRRLQSECKDREDSRKILLLLAMNSEYQEDYEKASLYYEQLLLYEEDYREGYGEYGMFLVRTGQEKEAEKLWKQYKKKEVNLDESTGRNLVLWEREMTKNEEK